MQGRRDLAMVAAAVMDELVPLVDAQYGGFYLTDEADPLELRLVGSYGHPDGDRPAARFRVGQSLVGQAARSKRPIVVDDVPPGYATISSGLGSTAPASLIVLPIVVEDQVLGVIELASVRGFTAVHRSFLELLMEQIGVNVNSIVANARTDELLGESQRLTAELQARSEELQARQEELQSSNAELEEKAALLATQNSDIEQKNLEIEQARQELETRAQQLTLASKYKSEFLANMSHELRTPLNSLLILAQLLAQNPAGNLSAKQVEYAGIIHSAGSDLLQLINDILDLSKVEAGKMDVTPEPVSLRRLLDYVEATFRPMTSQRNLDFRITTAPGSPAELLTDDSRLRQVLRNLLSNAVKFTEVGSVELHIEPVPADQLPHQVRAHGPAIAFRVTDTGIGIAEHQLESIFGAFQQADGTTSRKYGGTGLGLSISREIAQLLGGHISAESTLGEGSTFTFYVPVARPDFTGLPADDPGSPLAVAAGAESLPRRLLVVEERQRGLLTLVAESAVASLAGPASHPDVQVITAAGTQEAAAALATDAYHCMVLDLDLPGQAAFSFLTAMKGDSAFSAVPVLAHNSRRLLGTQEQLLRSYSDVSSLEVLSGLDELRERITLHLSAEEPGAVLPLMRSELPAAPVQPADVDGSLNGRTVLIVDDDPRNVFALTGILEMHGMRVLHAEDGRKGVEIVVAHAGIDLVLMDVMMPEMDGYAATEAIRAMPERAGLPIIAVTAKAMPGDREKSISAGATDYVTKPLDADDLIARIKRYVTN